MSTANGWLKQLRREQNLHWMHESLQEGLMQLFMENPIVKQRLALLEQRVTAGQITPVNGARELLSIFESDRGV